MTDTDLTACLANLDARVQRLERRDKERAADLAALQAHVMGEAPDRACDPVRWRRYLLRELKFRHYRLMTRSGAAIAIAGDWAAFSEARLNAPPEPGTREALFEQLGRPMSAKTIQNDLAGP